MISPSRFRVRFLSSLGAILLATSGLIAGGALPATAASASAINKYVALGDSFAAGQGAPSYMNDVCLQNSNGYPALLNAVKGVNLLRNASCRGATTADVISTQVSALNRGTTLVTLTVGGNDLDVAGVAMACTPAPGPTCAEAIADASALLYSGVLATNLTAAYGSIAAAAPNARILITGYPYLFDPSISDPYGLVATINAATTALNATIYGVVGQVQLAGANIHYVDVTGVFATHGIGSGDPWINSSGPDGFHPNALGYAAYEGVLKDVLYP